jgi:hypothetical protein
MTIFIKRTPKELKESGTPFKVIMLVVITIKLAGMGTMICSRIHPRNTAQAPLLMMNDSKLASREDNTSTPFMSNVWESSNEGCKSTVIIKNLHIQKI